jgi:hypothetical protein
MAYVTINNTLITAPNNNPINDQNEPLTGLYWKDWAWGLDLVGGFYFFINVCVYELASVDNFTVYIPLVMLPTFIVLSFEVSF